MSEQLAARLPARDRRRRGARDARPAARGAPAPPPPLLTDAEMERYSRQLVLPEWSEAAQLALREASVLVIGAGALGSPVALYLAGAGVGRLGIVDADVVELSNLHRQLLHFTPDVGVPKAESAAAKLGFLNPEVVVEPYQVRVDETNAAGLVEGQDLVVDCSRLLRDPLRRQRRLLRGRDQARRGRRDRRERHGDGRSGRARSACYRCAFPKAPQHPASCAEAGVSARRPA